MSCCSGTVVLCRCCCGGCCCLSLSSWLQYEIFMCSVELIPNNSSGFVLECFMEINVEVFLYCYCSYKRWKWAWIYLQCRQLMSRQVLCSVSVWLTNQFFLISLGSSPLLKLCTMLATGTNLSLKRFLLLHYLDLKLLRWDFASLCFIFLRFSWCNRGKNVRLSLWKGVNL